jgi:hypothetical protein
VSAEETAQQQRITRLFIVINLVWICLIAVIGSGLLKLGGTQETDDAGCSQRLRGTTAARGECVATATGRLHTVMYLWLIVYVAGTVAWLAIHKRQGKCGTTSFAAFCCFFGVPTCLCPGDNERLRVDALYSGRRSTRTPIGLVAPTETEATCVRCEGSCTKGTVCEKCTNQVESLIAALPKPQPAPEGPEGAARPPDCVVCCAEICDPAEVTMLPCGHAFHHDCIVPWLAQGRCPTCPVCRSNLLDVVDVSYLLQL